MTELSFLLELILDDEVPAAIKIKLKKRIKVVEASMTTSAAPLMNRVNMPVVNSFTQNAAIPLPPELQGQSPSTVAKLLGADLPFKAPSAPPQPAVVAQTLAAAQAMASRQETIANAMSGKPEKGRTSPRKF